MSVKITLREWWKSRVKNKLVAIMWDFRQSDTTLFPGPLYFPFPTFWLRVGEEGKTLGARLSLIFTMSYSVQSCSYYCYWMEVRAIAIPFVFCCSYCIICFFGHQHLCGRGICKGSKRFLSCERFQYFSLQVYMALRLACHKCKLCF